MIWRATFLALSLLANGPAFAAVSRAVLDQVYVDPTPGAALPLNLTFQDDGGQSRTLGQALDGHAAVLIFADYTCRTLCGPILDFTATALQQSKLHPGTDYRLIVIGLDPKDSLDAARAMKASRLDNGGPISRAATFLTGTTATIRATTAALGYHFAYDRDNDQFAHPAAAFVLTRDGKVTRVLSGLGINGTDLRLALVDAGEGQVGTLSDRFHLLCYGFDPARGIYTARIGLILKFCGGITVALMAGGILLMHRMTRAMS